MSAITSRYCCSGRQTFSVAKVEPARKGFADGRLEPKFYSEYNTIP